MKTFKILSGAATVLFGLLLFSNKAQAQDARAGIKGGLNVSNLYIDEVDDENARFGFNIGLYGQLLSNEAVAIQPELLFSTKGARAQYTGFVDQDATFNLNYLDLPVLAVIKAGDVAEIHFGPYFSYLVSSNIKYEGDLFNGTDEVDRDDLSSVDWGLSGGLGLNFGAVQVGARYNYGMVKIADSDGAQSVLGDAKNSNAQLYVAFNLSN
jgi:hypothetical protein